MLQSGVQHEFLIAVLMYLTNHLNLEIKLLCRVLPHDRDTRRTSVELVGYRHIAEI